MSGQSSGIDFLESLKLRRRFRRLRSSRLVFHRARRSAALSFSRGGRVRSAATDHPRRPPGAARSITQGGGISAGTDVLVRRCTNLLVSDSGRMPILRAALTSTA